MSAGICSTLSFSPATTLYCLPPVFMTAYMGTSSIDIWDNFLRSHCAKIFLPERPQKLHADSGKPQIIHGLSQRVKALASLPA
jgi:hypothetical protein